MEPRIESLLAARLFLSPQLWNNRIYFISNMSGHFSLYAMDDGGSVPEPLLPPDVALQNPELIEGDLFHVFPHLGKILVNIDNHGDEQYQPMFIPLEGGFPDPVFPELAGHQVFFEASRHHEDLIVLGAASLTETMTRSYIGDVARGTLELVAEGRWARILGDVNAADTQAVLGEGYSFGDTVLYLWQRQDQSFCVLAGIPIEDRAEGQDVPPNGLNNIYFTPSDRGLICTSALFEDTYGVTYLPLDPPGDAQPVPVTVTGLHHHGHGELIELRPLHDNRYLLHYNIDGVSWAYEGTFDEAARTLHLDTVLCGEGRLANGVMKSIHYDEASDRYVLAFSTAATPPQIYTLAGADRQTLTVQTRERVLGIPPEWLAPGEDASFTSFDGTPISARLYRPAPALGYDGPRPLVYYIHGGPQGQERPNFAWFSMPLIQFLTLNGFAVFVPNVRGSEGYGMRFMKQVDHDWGGQDRLDHVHAMTEVLPKDPRLDVTRAGVAGRSYGGFMTLTLATRHPHLWAAAVDMFGPFNLPVWVGRVPPTWEPYMSAVVGHPERDRAFLEERSPYTYVDQITCPLLVIQGAHDPRVIEQESRDLVEHLQGLGKEVAYLVFGDEGHDVIKYPNKVRCYTAITDFFKEHLRP